MRVFAKSRDDLYYCRNGIAYHYDHGELYSFDCSGQFLSALSRLFERNIVRQIETLRDTNIEVEVKQWFDEGWSPPQS
jgi:hypothetical protein